MRLPLRSTAVLALLTYSILAFSIPLFAHADAASRAQLEQELADVEAKIKQNQTELAAKQKERTSLERDVAILDAKIEAAQLAIKQRDLTIQELNADVADLQSGISHLDTKVAAGQQSLAEIIRETDRIDDTPMAVLLLNGSLTDALQDIDDFQTIQRAMGTAFTEMAATRSDLASREATLQEKQQEESDLRELQQLQEDSLQKTEKEKQDLVDAAKGQEANYQKIIAGQEESAAQIKQALFALNGGNHSTSFGDMVSYAEEASKQTGVRPALILGILAEESNLGQNVGTGNWKDDMNPTRDAPIFEQICAELGLNPDTQPVSKKAWYGWGGAMGPAQFIPSTWVLYEDRIAKITGQTPPNPWDPRTATFATALLMMDNGADAGTPAAERLAALRYLAGWKNAEKPAYSFYGDDVMELAAKYQGQIDILNGTSN